MWISCGSLGCRARGRKAPMDLGGQCAESLRRSMMRGTGRGRRAGVRVGNKWPKKNGVRVAEIAPTRGRHRESPSEWGRGRVLCTEYDLSSSVVSAPGPGGSRPLEALARARRTHPVSHQREALPYQKIRQ